MASGTGRPFGNRPMCRAIGCCPTESHASIPMERPAEPKIGYAVQREGLKTREPHMIVAPSDRPRPRGGKVFRALRGVPADASMQALVSGLILASISVVVLATQYWNFRSLYDTELLLAEEKHLVIANNLALALEQYAMDAASVVKYVATGRPDRTEDRPVSLLLERSGMSCVFVFDTNDALVDTFGTREGFCRDLPEGFALDELRRRASEAADRTYFSGILTVNDEKAFRLATLQPDETLAVAAVSAQRLDALQNSIAFGELGHAAIFDRDGRVIGHPITELERVSADASAVKPVAAMMEGRTGVMQFYAPPFREVMIAGYTSVPSAGWGVMVPQPIREIAQNTNASLSKSYFVASGVAILVAALSSLVVARIATGLRAMSAMASDIAAERYETPAPTIRPVSRELRDLHRSLREMSDRIRAARAAERSAADVEARASRTKTAFIYLLAHELNTPLNGITGGLALAELQTAPGDLAEAMALARTSSKRLQEVVDDATLFMELQLEDFRPQPVEVDLQAALRAALARAQSGARAGAETGDVFLRAVDGGATRVEIDEGMLQTLCAKIANACLRKAGGANVEVCYAVSQTGDKTRSLRIGFHYHGSSAEIRDIANLVDLSFGDYPSFGRTDGIFLGLAVARGIIDRLGGTLAFSEPAAGQSVIEVVLPVPATRHGAEV